MNSRSRSYALRKAMANYYYYYSLMCVAENRTCPYASDHLCGNGMCVAKENICDGYADCADKSDEDPTMCGENLVLLLLALI